jgi:hypothetical protein
MRHKSTKNVYFISYGIYGCHNIRVCCGAYNVLLLSRDVLVSNQVFCYQRSAINQDYDILVVSNLINWPNFDVHKIIQNVILLNKNIIRMYCFHWVHSFVHSLLPLFIEMLQYDWLWSGHIIIKEMFYIQVKLKPELTRASMTTSDVNNQWRSNFQQQII